ncbi:MAG: hypothetical protein JJU29_17950 [Verrucomicrobia bacterium]|nr:hypothetical protein [Verrucomicrobiota bacterium]MCH8514461.1 hypothetical protein [Kiritimatiellia bacterium]
MKERETLIGKRIMEKNNIGLAGEMRVCAEFLKKGYQASITFGNAKATDIIVTSPAGRYLRVEVKTSKNGRNFMTGFFPKYTNPSKPHPDLWVFYLPDKDLSTSGDRFFVATHDEVEEMQLIANKGNKTEKGKGADNIPLKVILEFSHEDAWTKTTRLLNSSEPVDGINF